ncbi:MAG TPA: PorT family protein [Bacteroidetes bacterium]|nr:PorT family protein [Bacteroidota bacterium]
MLKMKKSILIFLTVLISSGAFAQFNWGLKAGASSNNFNLESVTSGTQAALEAAEQASWGFHGGVFFRLSLFGLIVQPEVLLSMTENNMLYTEVAGTPADEIKSRFKKLDVPIMLGFRLGPVRLMAGPAASVMLNSSSDLIENTEDLYKNATFGYQAGVGVDIAEKITIDVRYEGGLTKYGDEVMVGGESFTLDGRANAVILSAGIMF